MMNAKTPDTRRDPTLSSAGNFPLGAAQGQALPAVGTPTLEPAGAPSLPSVGEPVFLPVGECAVAVQFGEAVDPAANDTVIHLEAALRAAPCHGLVELVPTYRSLLVIYDPLLTRADEVETAIRAKLQDQAASSKPARLWRIPVWYGGEAALDLDEIAQEKSMTREALIALHSGAQYRVYMIGFAPGFTYLGGVPSALHCPRLSKPRQLVPAGAIGIGGQQASINSVAGPSGWRFIGQTPVRPFDMARPEPFLFAAGDRIKFYPVTEPEAADLFARVRSGDVIVAPEVAE